MINNKAAKLIQYVLEARRTLTAETDLSPRNPAVNEALTALVTGLTQDYSRAEEAAVLNDPQVRAARRPLLEKLAVAEGEMEKFWAEDFCARDHLTADDFADFMYWGCYDRLVNGEIGLLPKSLSYSSDDSIAFIGAGPLPLTAIILHLRTGRPVTCVDSDPEACRLADALCRKAGLTGIDVVCCDGAAHDYKNHPAVFVASLVPNKQQVIEQIQQSGRTIFIGLRSAERLHTLLYDPVDEQALLAAGCHYDSKTAHDVKTINTTVFYESPAKPALAPAFYAPRSKKIWPDAGGHYRP